MIRLNFPGGFALIPNLGDYSHIFGRRSSGSFDIRLIDNTKVHAGINCRKLRFLSVSRGYLITKKRNGAIPPPAEAGSILAHFL